MAEHTPGTADDVIPTRAEVTATLTVPGGPFEMEEVVVRGIPTRTWKSAPASLRATATRTSSSTKTSGSPSSRTSATLLPSAISWSGASACSPATGWPSPCATSPTG
jgi:hypothetical protein